MASAPKSWSCQNVLGRRLSYRSRGAGLPLLLIHGLGADSRIWEDFELQGCELIAVDLPGSGGSERPVTVEGPGEVAARLASFMRGRGHATYAVIGHSYGALVGLEMALRSPANVRAAALISAPARLRLPFFARMTSAPYLGETLFGLSAFAPVSRSTIKTYLRFVFGESAQVTEKVVDTYAAIAASPGYHQAMLHGLRGLVGWKANGQLRRLQVPTVVIWGERDRLLPASMGRRFAQELPGARFHALPRCGHCPPEERPHEVARIVSALLHASGGAN